MTNDNEAAHVTETKRRLRENREWVQKWAAGEGSPDSAEMHRRNSMIREDEELLREWGETDTPES